MRSLLFILAGVAVLIISLPFAVLIWLFGSKDKSSKTPRFGSFCIKLISKFLSSLGGCDTELSGTENIPDTPSVFAGNHQGYFDALLVQFAFGSPVSTMAKKETAFIPIVNLWMVIDRCIFVDRKNRIKAVAAMKESIEIVKSGNSVVYFPEGTRSKGPNMGAFKIGAFKTAVSAEVPVVPFVIDGTYKVFEEPRRLKKNKVYMRILPPVYTDKDTNPKELMAEVKNKIGNELESIRKENKGGIKAE